MNWRNPITGVIRLRWVANLPYNPCVCVYINENVMHAEYIWHYLPHPFKMELCIVGSALNLHRDILVYLER